ncbi:sulfotransferase family protein [Pseudodesulfovibrio indicus]|uniref:Sulfotransferase family protein n=1 Tax=Pseudodesulfovibrio indicus TaxID=1716143 RepID=A0A126QJA9_9BACT|nr:sulfotransferase family protein [Pseudodesulfovibrio indicus]AMK10073.1 hypothetical protein AWY79_02550 [Pseudodesulfovibrio indicus]TDT86958.1 hypothetical protein EDC59_11039 [Pseudodesulfovibrio indicus]
MTNPKTIALVAGMHRSGTSVAARAVLSLGLHFGDDLMEESPDNPRGYFEDMAIVDHNRAMLEALTGDSAFGRLRPEGFTPAPALAYAENHCADVVREKFVESGVTGCKDPRFCLTYPLWREAFEAHNVIPSVIVPFRNPLEAARSLNGIHQVPVELGLKLWFAHNHAVLRNLADRGMLLLSFESILADPLGTLDVLRGFLGLDGDGSGEEFAAQFLSRDLKHYTLSPDDLKDACADCPEVAELYRTLTDYGHGTVISSSDARAIAERTDPGGRADAGPFGLGLLPYAPEAQKNVLNGVGTEEGNGDPGGAREQTG